MAFCKGAFRSRALAGVAVSLALTITACGSNDTNDTNATNATKDAGESASSPAGGKLRVGIDATYAPYEYKEGSDYVGIEVDLIEAIAEKIGREVEYVDVKYTVAEGALQAGRFDVEATGLSDTEERRAKFFMVNHTMSPQGLIVPTGNPEGLSDTASLCGMQIAIFESPATRDPLESANDATCADDPIEILGLSDANGPYAALQSGRADAVFNNYVQGAVQAEKMDAEAIPLEDGESTVVGFAVDKTNPDLAEELACAMQEVIDAGGLAEIAQTYNIDEAVMVDKGQINSGDVEVTC